MGGEGAVVGPSLSQTCSRRNNRWLLNRKRTRFLWGRRYRYENALALRKRTTCLMSSVSFVSRFLPVNKPGLHPPAAARHPSSKHKARLARRLAMPESSALLFRHVSISLPPSFLSLARPAVFAVSFFRLHATTSFLRTVRFDLRWATPCCARRFPRVYTYTQRCLPFCIKNTSCVFSEIRRALVT